MVQLRGVRIAGPARLNYNPELEEMI